MITAKVTTPSKSLPALHSAEDVAQKVHIPAKRLMELARDGFAPCWIIDNGPPLFQVKILQDWVAQNLSRIQEGSTPPDVHVIAPTPAIDTGRVPPVLRAIRGLFEISIQDVSHRPGVYFLCDGDSVVYVGQSTAPHVRIASHVLSSEKNGAFDRAFVVPCLQEHLTDVENAFIRALSPRLNRGFPSSCSDGVSDIIFSLSEKDPRHRGQKSPSSKVSETKQTGVADFCESDRTNG